MRSLIVSGSSAGRSMDPVGVFWVERGVSVLG